MKFKDKIKLVGSEQPCNTTPNNFSATVVRIYNKDDTAAYTLTVKENPRAAVCTINATANATTLITLSAGDTSLLKVGESLIDTTDATVINTDVVSVIASIIDANSFASDVDIIVATGDATIYAVEAVKTITVQPGKELFLEKGAADSVESDENTNVVAVAVAYSS
jgi:hypothetical protein